MNNFKEYLIEFKNSVDNFQQKQLMEKLIRDRLEKSFELYKKNLMEVYNFTLTRNPYTSIKRVSKLIVG